MAVKANPEKAKKCVSILRQISSLALEAADLFDTLFDEEPSEEPIMQEMPDSEVAAVSTEGWEDVLTTLGFPQDKWQEAVACITSANPDITPEQYAKTCPALRDQHITEGYQPSRSIPQAGIDNFEQWFPMWFYRSGMSNGNSVKSCFRKLSIEYTGILDKVLQMNVFSSDEALYHGVMQPVAIQFAKLLVRTYGDNINCAALEYLLTVERERRVLAFLANLSVYMTSFSELDKNGFAASQSITSRNAYEMLLGYYPAQFGDNAEHQLSALGETTPASYMIQIAGIAFVTPMIIGGDGMIHVDVENSLKESIEKGYAVLSMLKSSSSSTLLSPETIRAVALREKCDDWLKVHARVPCLSTVSLTGLSDEELMVLISGFWELSSDELGAAKQELQMAALRLHMPSVFRRVMERSTEKVQFTDTDRDILRFARYVDTVMKSLRGQQYYTSLPSHASVDRMRSSDTYNKYHGILDWMNKHGIDPLTWVDAQTSRLTFEGVQLNHSMSHESIHSILGFRRVLKVKEKTWGKLNGITKGCARYSYPEECYYEPSEKAMSIYQHYSEDHNAQVELSLYGHNYAKAAYGKSDKAAADVESDTKTGYTNSLEDYNTLINLMKSGNMMSDTAFENLVTGELTTLLRRALDTARASTSMPREIVSKPDTQAWLAAAEHVENVREVKFRTLWDSYMELHPITALGMYWETGYADIVVQVTDTLNRKSLTEFQKARKDVLDMFIDFTAEHKEWAARLKRIFHNVVSKVEAKWALPSGWKRDNFVECFVNPDKAYVMACACT